MTTICSSPEGPAPTRRCSTCDTTGECVDEYSPGIVIHGPARANGVVRGWLDVLKSTPTGGRLLVFLDRAAASSGPTHIHPWRGFGDRWSIIHLPDAEEPAATGIDPSVPHRARVVPGRRGLLGQTVIFYSEHWYVDANNPAPALLGHELIHALHWVDGTYAGAREDRRNAADHQKGAADVLAPVEEVRTVGLREWAWEEFNENRIRRELRAPQRVEYFDLVLPGTRQ